MTGEPRLSVCTNMSIPVVELENAQPGSLEIFPGEVKDSILTLHRLAHGSSISRKGRRDRDGVLFVVSGSVHLAWGGRFAAASAQTLVRFPPGADWSVAAPEEACLLEIGRILDEADRRVLARDPQKHADIILRNIADCPTYREKIKSEKTVNRMLLPEGYVPRLCMGSVQTRGPDDVGVHEHPMLDQLFLGLEDCRCTVFADDAAALLEEGWLLHIPLASRHRVSVAEGDLLHYMWIDFFETLEGEAYMGQAHQMDGEG